MQPNAVAHVAVDDHWPALDHAHRKPTVDFSFDGVELDDVENKCLAGHCRLPADSSPLVRTILAHDDITENPERPISWFRQLESFVATSIGHCL